MAQRGSARIVTQRRFDDSVEPAAPRVPSTPLETGEAGGSPPPSPIDRSASDLGLRARQRTWVRERERFESRKARATGPEGTK